MPSLTRATAIGLVISLGVLSRVVAARHHPSSPRTVTELPAQPPSSAPTTPTASAPANAHAQCRSLSAATFSGSDVLDACIDVEIYSNAWRELDAANGEFDGWSSGTEQTVIDDILGPIKKARAVHQSCDAEFADRTQLASCSVYLDSDAGTLASFEAHYYDTESLDRSDAAHKRCLLERGTWWSAPHEGAAQAERVRQHMLFLQHAIKQIQQ